jgi:hypothetical protein
MLLVPAAVAKFQLKTLKCDRTKYSKNKKAVNHKNIVPKTR